MCTAFEEYKEVPKMVPFNFTEDDITWVTSKLSEAVGTLGVEEIELRKLFILFG